RAPRGSRSGWCRTRRPGAWARSWPRLSQLNPWGPIGGPRLGMMGPGTTVQEALPMIATPDYRALLDTAIAEARKGLAEGGIPIGAALYHQDGRLLGCGHNRRVQEGDPSVHGETDAFRKAGRQRRYKDTIMVTTLAP